MSYLGLDIGTTGCKAAVFDADGRSLALAYREYPLLSPQPGWAEVDSVAVCRKCCDVIREAAASSHRDPVVALAISSQGEAFTPVGEQGQLLANGMVSSDAPAVDVAASFSREFGAQRLYDLTGHTPHPMFTLFKLLWTREHRPDVWRQARRFLCFEDLLHAQLGLEPHLGWSLGGTDDVVRRHLPRVVAGDSRSRRNGTVLVGDTAGVWFVRRDHPAARCF